MTKFKFKIRNIKHFDDTGKDIILNLSEKKINLVSSPNGSGKSSFSKALECLLPSKLVVELAYRHKKRKAARPSITLSIDDGPTYTANGSFNQIAPIITPYVINSRLEPVSESIPQGHDVLNHPDLKVARVKIKDNIPFKIAIPYDYESMVAGFGDKGRILPNLKPFINTPDYLRVYAKVWPCIQYLIYYAHIQDKVMNVRDRLNAKPGDHTHLRGNVTDADFKEFRRLAKYNDFKTSVEGLLQPNPDSLDYYLLFYQLYVIYRDHSQTVKDACLREQYDVYYTRWKDDLQNVKCEWLSARLVEDDNNLFVEYPYANENSNGERDLMTFYTQLQHFKNQRQNNKDYLLVVDEVFDYLDESNLLAAQYFLTSIINDESYANSKVYIVLLSHMPKYNFSTYVLNKIMAPIQFLNDNNVQPNVDTKSFITYRAWLKNDAGNQPRVDLYKDLCNNLFHYNPALVDYTARIHAEERGGNQPHENWGNKATFYTHLIAEVNKYLSSQAYDPFAVALSLRIRIEKMAYNLLQTQEQRDEFLAVEDKTEERLKVCDTYGFTLSTHFYLILPISNEVCHLSMDSRSIEKEKRVIQFLKSPMVRNLVRLLYDYQDAPLDNSVIL